MPRQHNACVLVTGIYPEFLDRDKLKESVDDIKAKFAGYDIYWQSWDNETNREILEPLGLDILWVEQHEITVNSYERLYRTGWMNPDFEVKYKKLQRSPEKLTKLMNRTLQLLAQADIVESLPKKYDIHIRTRWDVYFSPSFNIDDWIELGYDRPVGFAFSNQIPLDDTDKDMDMDDRILAKRKKVKSLIDAGEYDVKKCIEDEKETEYWKYMIYDFCMIYKADLFNPAMARKLHDTGKLFPAEYGWYQLLNKNNDHYNVNGLVATRRLVDSDKETLDRLRKSGHA